MNEGDYAINDILMVTQPNSCRNAFFSCFLGWKIEKINISQISEHFSKKIHNTISIANLILYKKGKNEIFCNSTGNRFYMRFKSRNRVFLVF